MSAKRYKWWWSKEQLELEVVDRFELTCDLIKQVATRFTGKEIGLETNTYMPLQEQLKIASHLGIVGFVEMQKWQSVGRVRNQIMLREFRGSKAILRAKIDEAAEVAEHLVCRMPFVPQAGENVAFLPVQEDQPNS